MRIALCHTWWIEINKNFKRKKKLKMKNDKHVHEGGFSHSHISQLKWVIVKRRPLCHNFSQVQIKSTIISSLFQLGRAYDLGLSQSIWSVFLRESHRDQLWQMSYFSNFVKHHYITSILIHYKIFAIANNYICHLSSPIFWVTKFEEV
jgi:hypothetical protein